MIERETVFISLQLKAEKGGASARKREYNMIREWIKYYPYIKHIDLLKMQIPHRRFEGNMAETYNDQSEEIRQIWLELNDLKAEGLTRSLGVTAW